MPRSEALGSGDNAFATTDLVWRNTGSGQNVFWGLLGTEIGSSGVYQTVADANWKLEATADFDNDGFTDFAWRNYATGENAIWYLDEAGTIKGVGHLTPLADANWHLVAAVDMDRDGHPDALWRNYATGQNAIWYLNGTNINRSAYVQTLADANWKLRGAGDLDGDGRPELLWRNSATGQNAAWFMSGDDNSTIARGEFLTAVGDANWQLETIADVDHDGKADLLWRNLASGETAVWFMNGATLQQGANLTPVGDANWRIVGTRRQHAHGAQFDAQPGTAAYTRGIRKWLVNPGRMTGDKTTVLGSDGNAVQVSTQLLVSELSGGSAHYDGMTLRALLLELGAQDAKTSRGTSWASTMPEYQKFWSSLVSDMPRSAPTPRDGRGGPTGDWTSCYNKSFLLGLELFEAVQGGVACLNAIGETISCGPAIFLTGGAVTPLCAGIAAVTVAGCAGELALMCAVNSGLVDVACCHGQSAKAWPWPNSCLPSNTAKCSCSENGLTNQHAAYSKGFLDDSVRCEAGQYKQLLKVRTRSAGTSGTGGYPCSIQAGPHVGQGGFSYAESTGYTEMNFDWWDFKPTIVPGKQTRQGGFPDNAPSPARCTTVGTNDVAPGDVRGQRNGNPVSIAGLAWLSSSRDAYGTVYNGDHAERVDKEVACEGWDSGPDSDYAKCAQARSAENGGNFQTHTVTPVTCTDDPCGAVGWNSP